MGNHSSRKNQSHETESTSNENDTGKEIPKRGILRSPSGADFQDTISTQLMPINKLAQILIRKSQSEEGVKGVAKKTFVKYVFPRYPDLGERLFVHLHTNSKAETSYLGELAFRQQCERFLGILDDSLILEGYIRMFSGSESTDIITPEGLKELLMTCYRLAMDHYSSGPQTCLLIQRTLSAVVESCFHSKKTLSPGYVLHWLEQNCPRLVPPVHKFCVHALSTSYRGIDTNEEGLGLELATPILDKPNPFGKMSEPPLLPVSLAWLLAGALPPLYSKPVKAASPSDSGVNLASQAFMAKLLSVVPSHWALLYDSREHGLGMNRFLHHVLAYKGPTLVLLRSEEGHVFCIGAPCEWKESHQYWGTQDSCVIKLLPKFSLIEKGPKMLYLNTLIRGYPKGLRAGSDPRNPIISVDESFDRVNYQKIPYGLVFIEVWGCGDQQSRQVQLDIKKWQVNEAERQKQVKLSAADWIDHPDRYLLELAGRPQYNNSSK